MKRALLGCLVLLSACGGGPPIPPVVRDSAGVTIVENLEPTWRKGDRWRLAETPILDIGGAAADSDHRISRAVGSTRLDDGTVVVANAGTQELRWYDAAGRHLNTAGGKGGGPGEFESLEWVGRLGTGSVIAFDFGNLGLSVFDRDGTLQSSSTLVITFQAAPGSVYGVFADSSLLIVRDVRSWAASMIRSRATPEGPVRGPATASRYSIAGTFLNGLGTYPGSEQIFTKGRSRIVRVTGRPFGRGAVFAVARNRFYVGTQDEYEFAVYDTAEMLRAIVRLERENLAVTPDDTARYKRGRLAGVHERNRANRERELNALPYPETMPAYGRIMVDSDGNLWVAEYRPFGDEQPRWTVFDAEHRLLGSVETPLGFAVHEIGTDFVLGCLTDESDVQHIQLYALEKP